VASDPRFRQPVRMCAFASFMRGSESIGGSKKRSMECYLHAWRARKVHRVPRSSRGIRAESQFGQRRSLVGIRDRRRSKVGGSQAWNQVAIKSWDGTSAGTLCEVMDKRSTALQFRVSSDQEIESLTC
jgi:hypothetical protein